MNVAMIFAGGKGVRMGAGIPKQFIEVYQKPILIHTLEIFQEHDMIDLIYISVLEEYIEKTRKLVRKYGIDKMVSIVPGGATAQDSIYNVLKEAEKTCSGEDTVLLCDGVRPFISYDTIKNNIESVKKFGNAITCTPCYETILLSETGKIVESVPYRKNTYSAQAPQSFLLKDIISAHDEIRSINSTYENMVDACTIMKTLGKEVYMVEGNRGNIKVTTPEDVYMYRALLNYKESEQTFGYGLTNGFH